MGHRRAAAAATGGRPRTTCLRAVLDAIVYLLRTGCQWRLLPREYPPWSTVHLLPSGAGAWIRARQKAFWRDLATCNEW